jgi:hypothetical protein
VADWILYPVDRAVRLQGASVSASGGSDTAPNAVDGRPNSVWEPGAGTIYHWCNLGASYAIAGLGLANHNLSGVAIRAGRVASMGSTSFTSYQDFTPDDDEDFFGLFAPGAITGTYFLIRIASASTTHIGEISWVDDGAAIDTSGYGPRWPIDRSVMQLGYATLQTAGGAELNRSLGGMRQRLTLRLTGMPSGISSLGRSIEDSLRSYDAWADGVWVTGDEFGSVTIYQGRGYYCTLVDMPSLSIGDAGGRMIFTLPLAEKSHGIRVPA